MIFSLQREDYERLYDYLKEYYSRRYGWLSPFGAFGPDSAIVLEEDWDVVLGYHEGEPIEHKAAMEGWWLHVLSTFDRMDLPMQLTSYDPDGSVESKPVLLEGVLVKSTSGEARRTAPRISYEDAVALVEEFMPQGKGEEDAS